MSLEYEPASEPLHISVKAFDQYGLAGEKAYQRHMLFETPVIPTTET